MMEVRWSPTDENACPIIAARHSVTTLHPTERGIRTHHVVRIDGDLVLMCSYRTEDLYLTISNVKSGQKANVTCLLAAVSIRKCSS